MVWLNEMHINHTVPSGTFGGPMCICPICQKLRNPKPKEPKDAIEIMQEAQVETNGPNCTDPKMNATGHDGRPIPQDQIVDPGDFR